MAVARRQGAAFFEVRAALVLADLTGDDTPIGDALARVPEPAPWPDIVRARQRSMRA